MADKELMPPSIRIDREQFGRAWPVMSGDEVGGVEYIRADLCAQPAAQKSDEELAILKAERLQIQQALAETVLDDPTEDDNPPYSTAEIVNGIRMLEQRRKNALAALAAQRAQMVGEVERMRDEWEVKRNKLEPLSKMRNRYDAAFCAANEIIVALQPTEKQESEPLEEKQ